MTFGSRGSRSQDWHLGMTISSITYLISANAALSSSRREVGTTQHKTPLLLQACYRFLYVPMQIISSATPITVKNSAHAEIFFATVIALLKYIY